MPFPHDFGQDCEVIGIFDGLLYDIQGLHVNEEADVTDVFSTTGKHGHRVNSMSYEIKFETRREPHFLPTSKGHDYLIDDTYKMQLVGTILIGKEDHGVVYLVELVVSDINIEKR